jgi:hypothetical membrane protein
MLAKSRLFRLIMAGCAQFVLLTLLAMLVYAGGNAENPDAPGYQFFRNFFSDLGLTIAYNGEANTASFLLFTIALSLAGLSLIVFFILMPRFFKQDKMALALTWLGSLAGLVAGACFIGVAFTPANLLMQAHVNFVFGAFGSYFVAVLFYVAAMFKLPTFPRVYQLVLLAFAFILGGYVWLLFNGPENLTIQVTGQKIIAYASITTVFIQAYGAWQKERPTAG